MCDNLCRHFQPVKCLVLVQWLDHFLSVFAFSYIKGRVFLWNHYTHQAINFYNNKMSMCCFHCIDAESQTSHCVTTSPTEVSIKLDNFYYCCRNIQDHTKHGVLRKADCIWFWRNPRLSGYAILKCNGERKKSWLITKAVPQDASCSFFIYW